MNVGNFIKEGVRLFEFLGFGYFVGLKQEVQKVLLVLSVVLKGNNDGQNYDLGVGGEEKNEIKVLVSNVYVGEFDTYYFI